MSWFKPTGGFHRLRDQIHQTDAIPQLTLIGALVGLATGLLMVLFRFLIEYPLSFWLGQDVDSFETLPFWVRGLLPLAGALILAAIWTRIPAGQRKVGVSHVIEHLNNHSGRMPGRNIIAQSIGAIVALISGQSVGREGPAIHLGAGIASQIGQKTRLPNHSIQTLVGCGAAAAIAASFNTPIAGIIFSMEVILMEYTLAGFMPIMAAATTATLISRLVYGSSPAFEIPPITLGSLTEIPWLVLAGFTIGFAAALFNRLTRFFLRYQYLPIWLRFSVAGLVTGSLALVLPQVMGTGYDTVTATLDGQLTFYLLALIVVAKILATSVAIGMGIPAGLIGPALVMGASLGGIFGMLINQTPWFDGTDPAFYALIGMGAMMSAVLQAPLAALMAVMELTSNSLILFPAMLTLIIANLTSQHFFRQPSIFTSILAAQGLSTRTTPVAKAMRSISALRMAQTRLSILQGEMSIEELEEKLKENQQCLVRDTDTNTYYLASSNYLISRLNDYLEYQLQPEQADTAPETEIRLNPIQWMQDEQKLIYQPSHITLEQVLRILQSRESAGVILGISPNSPPEGIISTGQLMDYLSSLGEK